MKFLIFILLMLSPLFSFAEEIVQINENIIPVNEYKPNKNSKQIVVEKKEILTGNKAQMKSIPIYLNEKKIRYDSNGLPQYAPLTTNDIIFQY